MSEHKSDEFDQHLFQREVPPTQGDSPIGYAGDYEIVAVLPVENGWVGVKAVNCHPKGQSYTAVVDRVIAVAHVRRYVGEADVADPAGAYPHGTVETYLWPITAAVYGGLPIQDMNFRYLGWIREGDMRNQGVLAGLYHSVVGEEE